jgi:hypothetical protein
MFELFRNYMQNQIHQMQHDLIWRDPSSWGTLLVLDACRYDYFFEVATELDLAGDLYCADSEVCGTTAWYWKRWQGPPKSLDATLITANPYGVDRCPLVFSQIIKAWDDGDDQKLVDSERTMNYYRKYAAGGRAVVHFIPPHQPFINPLGLALYKKLDIDLAKIGPLTWGVREELNCLSQIQKWLANYGRAGHWPEIRAAYRQAIGCMVLRIVDWLDEFTPPVIITADHGEVVGEGGAGGLGGYGHCHSQDDVVWLQRLVPWFVFRPAGDPDPVKQRLKALGYVK